jgi:Helicase HerA, central domain
MAVTMPESRRHPQNQVAALALGCLFAAAVLQPGVLVGAAITLAWWRWLPTSLAGRITVVLTATGVFAITLPAVVWAWPWRLLIGTEPSLFVPSAWALHNPAPVIALSLLAEAFAGPAWATGVVLIRWTREGMPSDMIAKERKRLEERRARIGHLQPPEAPKESPGVLRLGVEGRRGDVDIQLPVDLAQHATVLGKMGSGKTTTAARLMEAAAIAGWPVVVVDAKGFGSLRTVAARFAHRFGATFRLVAPDDPASLRYNPCEGTPSQISNKLIGAFAFGESAEIYKQITEGPGGTGARIPHCARLRHCSDRWRRSSYGQ